MITSMPYFILI